MLDPGLEHMVRHGRLWRLSIGRRRLIGEAVVDAVLLLPVAALFLLTQGEGQWGPVWLIVLLTGGCAVSGLVRFEVGTGSTTPVQLMLVPLWFAVPPAWIPVFVGIGHVVGGLIENLRDGKDEPLWRTALHFGDAWPAVGPAVVLAIAGAPEPSFDELGIIALAMAAQVAVDFTVGVVVAWFLHGVPPRSMARIMVWVACVDSALAPIGLLAAVAIATEPAAILAVLPLIVVIGEFARERRERIDQALQLSTAYRGTAQLMGDVLEADDAYTGGEHTQGVVDMAVAVGLELKLAPLEMRDLEFGALLHDIGKLRIPNEVINKPGKLDEAEWEIIRRHPVYGQEMLDRVGGALSQAGRIVRAHHERWDGAGYPDGLERDQIPLAARIITACDSYSAMTTTRSYSAAMTAEEGLAELERCSGSQFDPTVVRALREVLARNPEIAASQRRGQVAAGAAAAALGLRPIL